MLTKTSKGICETLEFKDSIHYRLTCICGGSDCDTDLEVSRDESGLISLSFYSNLTRYCNSIFKRFKYACRILFTGSLEVYGCTLMNEKQIDDFIDALHEAKERLSDGLE